MWIEAGAIVEFSRGFDGLRVYSPLSSDTEVTGEIGERSRELSPVAAVRSNANWRVRRRSAASDGAARHGKRANRGESRVLPESSGHPKRELTRKRPQIDDPGYTSPLVTIPAPRVESTPSCRASHPSRASVGVSRRKARRILGTRVREDDRFAQQALQGLST